MKDRQRPNNEKLPKDIKDYWIQFAEAFIAPLRRNELLGNFVSNPSVTGAYAEAWVHSLVATMISNLSVSTGAVIRTTDIEQRRDRRRVPQSDLILWDPTEMPPLFQSGNFALIHTQAARAIIEIKRTLPNTEELQKQLQKQKMRLLNEYKRNVLAVVVAHRRPLFGEGLEPDWVPKQTGDGVRIARLLDSRTYDPDPDGIFALIYFLSYVARQSKTTPTKEQI